MKELKVGIIGIGSLSSFHIEAYKKNQMAHITSISDVNVKRAQSKAKELGNVKVYTDYREMLEKSDIDVVSVITSNSTHKAITIDALEAGKHVLCEKPPALNAKQAKQMQDAAYKNKKLLMFGFIRRFASNTVALKEYIDQGALGEIYYAKTGCLRRCGNPGGWFADKEISGGGALIDLGVHIIDLAMYLMGKPKPILVFANTYNKFPSNREVKGVSWYKAAGYGISKSNVEDLANVIIKFENGASLFIETSWDMHIKKDTTYLNIFGEDGGAQLEPEIEIYSEINNYLYDMKPVMNNTGFDFEQAFESEINHFISCILSNEQCICPAEDGVTIMKILDAAYISSEQGKVVEL